jgi:integral membrane protein (TIGR01906 family)
VKPFRRLLRRSLLAIAAAALAIGATTAIFLTPPVVHLLLSVSDAHTVLGVEPQVAEALSDALVGDLLTDGAFDAPLGDAPLLSAGERSHLVDVGNLLRAVLVAGLGGLIVLTLARARRRTWLRGAIRDGAAIIVGGALLAAAAFTLAFDATFAFFHGLFFAAGTWTFNPATDRLVQLYPQEFWTLAALLFCLTLALLSFIAYRMTARSR